MSQIVPNKMDVRNCIPDAHVRNYVTPKTFYLSAGPKCWVFSSAQGAVGTLKWAPLSSMFLQKHQSQNDPQMGFISFSGVLLLLRI